MDITIHPSPLSGKLTVIPSKSQAHRLLICAAFSDSVTDLICPETNQDIEATAQCLGQICENVQRTDWGYRVLPGSRINNKNLSVTLNCHESGSTLRFLLPIMGALGIDTVFRLEGRLPKRPLSPLWEEMGRMGCRLEWISENEISVTGQLCAGDYFIDGGVSSQFITGLLFATSLLRGDSNIHITGNLESKPYVEMTLQAMKVFGVEVKDFHVTGGQKYCSPGCVSVEGDWSNAAFFLAAKVLGSCLDVLGLNTDSPQGDRVVSEILQQLNCGMPTISAKDIPDLVPVLSVVAAAKHGAVFTDISRLRLKQSARVDSTIAMIRHLGGKAEADENTLTVFGTGLTGGTVDAVNDHRIAMAAAVAATVCKEDVTVLGAQCVKKSYPQFWEEYARLGGNYEQYLR